MENLKIFEMPVPGYLGFPAFAFECFTMYEFLRRLVIWLRRPQVVPLKPDTTRMGNTRGMGNTRRADTPEAGAMLPGVRLRSIGV